MLLEKKTELVKIDDPENHPCEIARAAEILQKGGLVAFPTETVYGLGANGLNPAATASIFAAKGRPQDNPLIVHIAVPSQMEALAREIPHSAWKLAERFWPGPLTMILKKRPVVPDVTSGGLDTVAIRLPSHPVARALIAKSGVPVAAPSANLSGSPSPTTAQHCVKDLTGRVDMILDGGRCGVGVESTVITLTGELPVVLRPGFVTPEELEEVLGKVLVDPAVTRQLEQGRQAASPGMKYKHYAPAARVVLLLGTTQQFCRYVNQKAQTEPGVFALGFGPEQQDLTVPFERLGETGEDQAARLFDCLRRLDERGAKTVYARCPEPKGVGLAVYNRLIRAAGFTLVELSAAGLA